MSNIQRVLNKPAQLQPAQMMKLWRHRPKIFIRDVFDVSLDLWQEEVTDLYMNNQRTGVIASKGPGKTFLQALLTHHFFITRFQPKIACVSISEAHLKANLWAELLRLRAMSPLVTASTNDGSERITLKGHEGYSFISARSFPKSADETQMASTLAGLHADNIMFVIDEAGSIPDAILSTADAALAGGESDTKSAKLLVMANPEQPKGVLYRAYLGKSIQKWAIYNISGDPDDPKRAPRVDINWAREQIAMYGRDDPFVMINVLGKYPNVSVNSLLSEPEIADSMARNIEEKHVRNSQHRMGVDVARGGVDRTVFARRRGLKAYLPESISSDVYGPELAGKIAFLQQEQGIERVFVDNTGGYGSSVIDSLQMFPQLDVTPVTYNAKAQDLRYYNKRTEMYMRLRDWVKKGGQLPNDPGLAEELMMPKIILHGGKVRLEEKEQIKARLGRSPDKADALAQTFADVEQQSFYADYSNAPLLQGKTHEEAVELWMNGQLGPGRVSHIADESQIDNRYRTSPNHKA